MIGIIGAIVGDLIGQSYEFQSTKDYNFKLLTDTSHVTDDSTCTIAVADWLLHTNRTHDELIDKLKYWCTKYNYGFAPSFKNWVNSDNRDPYNSFGNGSAMRVSPVAWVANSLEECIQLAKVSAEVTHNHPEGIKGAITIAVAIYLNRQGKSKDEIIDYILKETDYKLQSYDELHRTHKFLCICQCSVPACLTCWYESNSYEDCIRKEVSLGGDADTEACISGSICNANKDTCIDDDFLNKLCLNGYIPNEFIDIINEFHEKYES